MLVGSVCMGVVLLLGSCVLGLGARPSFFCYYTRGPSLLLTLVVLYYSWCIQHPPKMSVVGLCSHFVPPIANDTRTLSGLFSLDTAYTQQPFTSLPIQSSQQREQLLKILFHLNSDHSHILALSFIGP